MPSLRSQATLSSGRLAREIDRILAEVASEVDAVTEHPYPTPESLHRLHRGMRRLRTALGVWEALLSSNDREALRSLDRRLRRLTRLVGQVRDRDVALGLLEGVKHRPHSRSEADLLHRYQARLRDDARTGRELVRAFLRAERQARLFDQLGEAVRYRARAAQGSRLLRILQESGARERENVDRAQRRARRRPTMNRLHRLRIRVRRMRQVSDLAGVVDPGKYGTLANSLRRLQQHLGRLHDLDLLFLDLEPSLRKTGWGETLRKERSRQRRSIVKTLESSRFDALSLGAPRGSTAGRGARPLAP